MRSSGLNVTPVQKYEAHITKFAQELRLSSTYLGESGMLSRNCEQRASGEAVTEEA